MTPEQIKLELQAKIKEYEWQSKIISLEVINWLNDLIKRIDAPVKKEEIKKEFKVKVNVPVEDNEQKSEEIAHEEETWAENEEKPEEDEPAEVKKSPKRKITFKKK